MRALEPVSGECHRPRSNVCELKSPASVITSYSIHYTKLYEGIPAGGSHDIRMLPRTSHFLMLEEPELFYETLGDVMNSGRSRAGQ